MGDISDWIQSNWFELGSLLVQGAVLVTLGWFGRKLLRILSASYGQSEAARRLSPSNVAAQQRAIEQAYAPAAFEPDRQGSGGGTGTWPGFFAWLREPMGRGEIRSRNRVIRWFQEPMGS
jgi:hypothetical protein